MGFPSRLGGRGSGRRLIEALAVELAQVVGGSDQLAFAGTGLEAPALETAAAAFGCQLAAHPFARQEFGGDVAVRADPPARVRAAAPSGVSHRLACRRTAGPSDPRARPQPLVGTGHACVPCSRWPAAWPVLRHESCLDQGGLGAEPQRLSEQSGQGLLMTLAEAADRCVVRLLVRARHAVSETLAAAPLDPPTRTLAPLIAL